MDPAVPSPEDIQRLLPNLPDFAPGGEVVVRVDDRHPATVTVRRPDAPPLVYTVSGDALVPLDPSRDERIPGAALLADPDGLAKRLGLGVQSLREVRLVAYRPRRRAIARVVTEPDGQVFYLKLLTKQAYRTADTVLRSLDPFAGTVRLMLPCRWLSKPRILVAEEARGTSLQDLIVAGAPVDLDQLTAAIRSFFSAAPPAPLPERTLEDERDASATALRRGVRVLPEIESLAELVSELELPESSGDSLLHTDLHSKQIFIDDTMISLIDLEGVSAGNWRLDAVYLSEHLRLRSMQLPGAERLEQLSRDLLLSFGLDLRDDFVRVTSGLIRARFAGTYALRPQHLDLTRRLIRDARTSF